MNFIIWLVFLAAALLEVGGDAIIRKGLRGRSPVWIVLGCIMLAIYGLAVNSLKWDFSKSLGVYVGFFAFVSVMAGWVAFRERIPLSTWLGLALIMTGCLVIQFGRR